MNEIKLYVSPTGADENDGSKNSPFKTFGRAAEAVRTFVKSGFCSAVTIYFFEGIYDAYIELDENDSGTANCSVKYCAYGDGDVVFTNGKLIGKENFIPTGDDIKKRLDKIAAEHIVECDLAACGIKVDDKGNLYGADENLSNENKYGSDCELLCKDKRFCLTRYPNKSFLKIADVGDNDTVQEHKKHYPNGNVIICDDDTNNKIKTWQNCKNAFLQGYFKYDWSDGIASIAYFDTDNNKIYIDDDNSGYGMAADGAYVFRNILETLDLPGEYYIDKENLKMYVYPFDNEYDMEISVSQKNILRARNVSDITFEGICFKGTCTDAIDINGNNITLQDCKIFGVGGWAIKLYGNNNKVYGCDISNIGKGAISLSGGDVQTLTPSGNVIENNYIHDWSQDKWTYCGGVDASGCGNVIKHNEFEKSPHYAVYYNGNDNLIEYNYIHEVVQQAHDAGAIYGGRNWTAYGNVIRYNLLENIGNEEYFPVGIYWDDCHSGQTAFGNIIKNATGKSFLIGGGRDNVVENNLMLISEYPMLFDARGIEGAVYDGWYGGTKKDGVNWNIMKGVPIKSEIWAKRFPMLACISDDFANPDDPDFAPNPSRALVRNNICVCDNDYGFHVAPAVRKYGTIEHNLIYGSIDECIVKDSKYELKPEVKKLLPCFSEIPVDRIGRYK